MKYISVLVLLFAFGCTQTTQVSYHYPATKTVDSSDTYFGQTVKDPYRWLEYIETKADSDWFKKQAVYTDSTLAKIPGQDTLKAELKAYDKIKPVKYAGIRRQGDRYFFDKRLPGEEISKIFYRDGISVKDVLIFDPLTYEKGKVMQASFDVSDNGKILLLNLSEQGAEISFMVFKDIATGAYLPDKIQFAGGGFMDGSNDIVLYNKRKNGDVHDPENNLNTKFKIHKLGDPEAKDVELLSRTRYPGLNILPEDYPFVAYSQHGNYIFAGKGNVNPNQELFFAPKAELNAPAISWKPFCKYSDEVKNFIIRDNDVYCLTSKGNNNMRLVKTTLPSPDLSQAAEVYNGGDWKIEGITDAKDYIIITLSKNGVQYMVKKFNVKTGKVEDADLPLNGSIEIYPLSTQTNDCIVWNSSWTSPDHYYSYNLETGKFEKGAFYLDYAFPGAENLVSEEVEIPSYDGTMVPLSIIYDKTLLKKDGSNMCFITGYGAYGLSPYSPYFSAANLLLLKRGVVIAYAHIRGGGEKGENWHLQGMKTTKPNTWKDFNACADYLVKNKYTSSDKLGCSGASAGGILIGRAITDRPDLYKVAIPKVGCLNAMRMEFSPNGPVNIPEFGTVKKQDEFKALLEMDAYLHVKPGVKYPAQLITTGFNDPRVISWVPAKFAAAMQADNAATANPVLLYVNYKGGHFGGSTMSELFNEIAFEDAFFLWQCGDPDFQPKNI